MNKEILAQFICARLKETEEYCSVDSPDCVTLDGFFNIEKLAENILEFVQKGK